jgi:cytochrome c-type biogenesis protein CcmH/NrfG
MAAYGLAIFTGAFLLFQVQPLMGKYLLPLFGGAPGVWTACLLFFQVLLLAGYAYAHVSVRWLRPRAQVLLHLGLLLIAIGMLPITPGRSWQPQTEASQTLQILLLLMRCVGLPYFVLSATAPLVQHWSSQTHPDESPFRLYALSNAASLIALLSYPTLCEAHLTRATQAAIWSAGLGLYAIGCAWAGVRVWKSPAPHIPPEQIGPVSKPELDDRVLWLAFPACASLLLLAVTNTICQDIATVPLLWVLPLALYLVSFTFCFASERCYSRLWSGIALFPLLVTICGLRSGTFALPTWAQIAVYSVGLLVCGMICHGEVYRLRPEPAHLTGFYLTVTAGGALGGIFVAVIAPVIFQDYIELDWGLILCGCLFLIVWARKRDEQQIGSWRPIIWSTACLALGALALLLWHSAHEYDAIRVARTRNFYGVLKVFRHEFQDPELNLVELVHGRVAHGVQFLDPARSSWPTLYYTPQSGVGRAFAAIPPGKRRVGVVGLGAGTLAAYAQAGDEIRFYEINPEVVRLAKTHFTYLQKSAGQVTVALGDARLSLENEPPKNFDLLVLDAFNSDSIPVHLLTREAFQIYQRHLNTNGVLAVNISNRSLDLEPVLGQLARLFGFQAIVIHEPETDELHGILPSTWVLLTRNVEFAQNPMIRDASRALASGGPVRMWTDDYSSLFSIVRWRDHSAAEAIASTQTVPFAKTSPPDNSKVAAQIARFREVVNRDPNSPVALNNLACLLATVGDPSLRDGAEAVRLAERARELTESQNTSVLSTLAAAYAENGRFDEAVTTAEKACVLAKARGETHLLEGNQRMLEIYKRRQAYHVPMSAVR